MQEPDQNSSTAASMVIIDHLCNGTKADWDDISRIAIQVNVTHVQRRHGSWKEKEEWMRSYFSPQNLKEWGTRCKYEYIVARSCKSSSMSSDSGSEPLNAFSVNTTEAARDGEVIGYTMLLPKGFHYTTAPPRSYAKPGVTVPHLNSLYIKEGWRNQGVGSALLDASGRYMLEQGHGVLELAVSEDNIDAQRFYDRAGYKFDTVWSKEHGATDTYQLRAKALTREG